MQLYYRNDCHVSLIASDADSCPLPGAYFVTLLKPSNILNLAAHPHKAGNSFPHRGVIAATRFRGA